MSKDGFASLSGAMLVRTGSLPHAASSPELDRAELRESHNAPTAHLDVSKQQESPAAPVNRQPVPFSDQLFYTGPERRAVNVSPLVERRRSAPPRVKISVRLEPHRYKRLRTAAAELGRTHQDLMTGALDHYLDLLRIAQIEPKTRHRP